MRAIRVALVSSAACLAVAGCGNSSKPNPARSRQAPAQLVVGNVAIRRALAAKLGADRQLGFDLGHPLTREDRASDYSDCYVVLGARAAAFEADSPAANFLHSPDGGTIFVQSGSTIPLGRCLAAVRSALGWSA